MADRNTTLRGNPMPLQGDALAAGQKAPDFTLTGADMKPVTLAETAGSVRIVNVLPSLDTPVCDAQTRRFNEEAVKDGKVKVLAISRDLPFSQKRWCAAAGVENVQTLSDYRDGSFGASWGVMIEPLLIHSRAVFVLDSESNITYAEYVTEMSEHPNYDAALAAAKAAK
ncbi:MAG: thiol peroxidase [Acidobacteria bacterium]|nr:thiol peroxidase [Acidobacteriota bacterium]MDA1234822.1 thiol peroxidase [Acidobacteriota bacterium]